MTDFLDTYAAELESTEPRPAIADGTGRHSRKEMDAATVDDLRRQVDELTAVLARREAEDARNERVLSVLRRLRSALPERIRHELSTDSLRLLNALDAADALLVEVER